MQIVASGVDTVHPNELFAFLKNYMSTEPVDCIVVGDPKRLNNEPAQATRCWPTDNRLKKEFPNVRFDRMDERFTSKWRLEHD